MQLIELLEKDKDRYNQFVAASQSGSFLQGFEWGQWQVRLGRTVSRFKIVDDSGAQIASIQLIKMPLPFGKYYLYAPYGPVLAGGEQFQVEKPALSESRMGFKFLTQELQYKFSDAIFIRIEPKYSFNFQLSTFNWSILKSANIQPGKTLIIDLSKSDEQLLSEMHYKTRYNIKVAQKHGVEIQDEFVLNIGQGFYFEQAIDVIVQTAGRQDYGGYGKEYYRKMIDFLALQNYNGNLKLHIYKALYNSQLLASAIMLDFGKTRTFLFGGSSHENKNVMAPYLLHWQAILDAKKQNLSAYDFWGIETSSGEVPGFVKFKLGFGGSSVSYAGAYDIVINYFWYKVYNIFRFLNRLRK